MGRVVQLRGERRCPPPPERRVSASGDASLVAVATAIWLGLNALAYGVLTCLYDLLSGTSPWLQWSWHPHWFAAQAVVCAVGYLWGVAVDLAERDRRWP